MKNLSNDLPPHPLPGAGANESPKILYTVTEHFIPGIKEKSPDFFPTIKKALLRKENAEPLIRDQLADLHEALSFDLPRLAELLHGMNAIIQLNKLQTFQELDLFIAAHQEMFGQILLDGIEEHSNDDSGQPNSAK